MSKKDKPKSKTASSTASTTASPASAASTASKKAPSSAPSGASSAQEGAYNITLQNSRPFTLEGREMPVKILQVIDGNTIVVGFILFRARWNLTCRCAGFTCADIHSRDANDRAHAQCARDFLSQLLTDKVVIASFGALDKYRRQLISIVLPDKRDLARLMISEGHAGGAD